MIPKIQCERISLLIALNLKYIKMPCRNSAICNTSDESRGHYNKWNKPDRKEQIVYDSTYMKHLKSSNSWMHGIECWLELLAGREGK